MGKTICAACGGTGGRFRWRGDKYYHIPACVTMTHGDRMRETATNLFPYETMNLGDDPNNGPIRVQSLSHLRRLENTYGVASDPFNNDRGPQGEKY